MTPTTKQQYDLKRHLLADKIAARLKKDDRQLHDFVFRHLLQWPDDYVDRELDIEGIKVPKEKGNA